MRVFSTSKNIVFGFARILLLACAFLASFPSMADIQLAGKNRVIFTGDQRRVLLQLVNSDDSAALANISLDWGDGRQADPHMVVSRPVISIPPHEHGSVEVFYQGVGLPQDRESYFLLSLLSAPLAPSPGNTLQVALRHRYKFFYRPQLTVAPAEAANSLRWQRVRKTGAVKAINPSPYYLTITDLKLQEKSGKNCGIHIPHTMLAPFSEATLQTEGCEKAIERLQYNLVSDSGREHSHVVVVSQPEVET
ncbi:fimbrial biogenesis chaperone [Achromobacter insolitus]|uniref:fimbrial biogenesis chaperone n=1 Tax=Achromobacter insolitus TaxID=217204 RepID=UPI0027DF2812|nr:molecular chaperone [Achromobacter insolitus]MDQ6211718.1 molecular chaperone [Achromobacter insolitus]